MNTEIKIYKDIDSELRNIWLDFEKESCNHCFQSFSWLIYLIKVWINIKNNYNKIMYNNLKK